MHCKTVREQLGTFVDGELADPQRRAVDAHVAGCAACRAELDALRRLAAALAAPPVQKPPAGLWPAIVRRLDRARAPAGWPVYRLSGRRPMAAAAAVALAIGLSMLGPLLFGPRTSSTARAASLDFSVLLDGLSAGANEAFDRFLAQHDARPISAAATQTEASRLSFRVPAALPGGYRLEQAYRLRAGDKTAVAARYTRGDDVLMTFVHSHLPDERTGAHAYAPCSVGDRQCRQVEVGRWRLVRLEEETRCACGKADGVCRCGMEPTTCHCILTTLDPATELPPIFAAIAPR